MTAPPKKLPRLPFVLLGLMTIFSFGGPLLIGYVLQGGTSPKWPPDRPVEWFTLLGVSGMVVVLMLGCFSLLLVNKTEMKKAIAPPERSQTGVEP